MKAVVLAMAAAAWSGAAKAQSLNLYCSVQIEWCQAIAVNFQRDTGIRVNMTQKGSGEMLAQIRAESQNPRGDVWFGGTGDPHLAAAEENLTVENESKALADLSPWAQLQYTASKKRAIGVYAGIVGFGLNTELLARKNLPQPASWADLLKPGYKGEIQVANPNSSGTAYVIIAARADHGRGQGLRVHEGAASQHQRLRPLRHRPDQGGGARRDGDLALLRA
jgi:iron(III) transport system substrate-binding protein